MTPLTVRSMTAWDRWRLKRLILRLLQRLSDMRGAREKGGAK
jgi:hypothetical protein